MSSVGGVGSTAAERLRLFLTPPASSVESTQSAARTLSSSASATAAGSTTAETNENGVAALWQQIEAAIEAALRSLDSSSASAAEVMDAVHGAVDRTLRANGVDPGSRPEPPAGGARPEGPPPGGAAGPGAPPPGGPPMGPPPEGESDGISSLIDRLLEENGFDADAIRQELRESWSTAAAGVSSSSGESASATSQGAALAALALIPFSEGVDAQV